VAEAARLLGRDHTRMYALLIVAAIRLHQVI
jgi:hypothetical protein